MTGAAPRRGVPAWLRDLAQVFGAGGPSGEPTEARIRYQEVEEAILGGSRRYTRDQLIAGTQLSNVADQPADGAEIALRLLERIAEAPTLPDLRIGLALGPVVTRFGDVYGEVVNIAARLTTHARPGTTLVDRNLAAALEHDKSLRLRARRPLAVRGYRHLHTWSLSRAR